MATSAQLYTPHCVCFRVFSRLLLRFVPHYPYRDENLAVDRGPLRRAP